MKIKKSKVVKKRKLKLLTENYNKHIINKVIENYKHNSI